MPPPGMPEMCSGSAKGFVKVVKGLVRFDPESVP